MRMILSRALPMLLLACSIASAAEESPATPSFFSPDSFWNRKLADNAPVAHDSEKLVAELIQESRAVLGGGMKNPWMNRDKYSTPLYYADARTPRFPVTIIDLSGNVRSSSLLHEEAQKGVPIPPGAVSGAGTDGHITIYDRDADVLYEFWQFWNIGGRWQASWGGILKDASKSEGIMPTLKDKNGRDEYWGATATGLPVIGGTVLLSELKAGKIPHALALSTAFPQDTFVWPAQRGDGDRGKIIPEGTRFRLKPDIAIDPSWPPLLKMLVEAARDYGMVVRDRTHCIVTFYGEDPRPSGSDPYPCYLDGMELEDVLKKFPFEELVALKSPGRARKYAPESRMDGGVPADASTRDLKKERRELLAAHASLNQYEAVEAQAAGALLASRLNEIEKELAFRRRLWPAQPSNVSSEKPEAAVLLETLEKLERRFGQAAQLSPEEKTVQRFVNQRLFRIRQKAVGVYEIPPDLPVEPGCEPEKAPNTGEANGI